MPCFQYRPYGDGAMRRLGEPSAFTTGRPFLVMSAREGDIGSQAMGEIANMLIKVRDDLARMSELTGAQAGACSACWRTRMAWPATPQQIARDLNAVGGQTSQREITDEAAALIQRIDTLTSVLGRAASIFDSRHGSRRRQPGSSPRDGVEHHSTASRHRLARRRPNR